MRLQMKTLAKAGFLCMSAFFATTFINNLTPATNTYAATTTKYTTVSLNFREEPSTSAEVISTFSAGQKITVVSETDEWCTVTYEGDTGYVSKEYVSDEWAAYSKTDNLNLRQEANTTSEVLDQIDAGEKVSVIKKTDDWYQVEFEGNTGYLRNDFITFQYCGYVKGSGINIRSLPNTESDVVTTLGSGDKVSILGKTDDWYNVSYDSQTGYIREDLITFDEEEATFSIGDSIVSYATQFLGNPYVYGGTSLTNGTDCSGFTQSVYAHFGIYLPRSSAAQRSAGTRVNSLSEAKPGDLICYYGHVGIYMGGDAVIHASNERTGIKITYNAAYRKIASIRRVF